MFTVPFHLLRPPQNRTCNASVAGNPGLATTALPCDFRRFLAQSYVRHSASSHISFASSPAIATPQRVTRIVDSLATLLSVLAHYSLLRLRQIASARSSNICSTLFNYITHTHAFAVVTPFTPFTPSPLHVENSGLRRGAFITDTPPTLPSGFKQLNFWLYCAFKSRKTLNVHKYKWETNNVREYIRSSPPLQFPAYATGTHTTNGF